MEELTIRIKVDKNSSDKIKEFADAIWERENPEWARNIPGWPRNNKRLVSARGSAFIEYALDYIQKAEKLKSNEQRVEVKQEETDDYGFA